MTSHYSQKDVEDVVIYRVDAKMMMEEYGMQGDDAVLNCGLTIYAPQIFANIVNSFFRNVDFANSLSLLHNAAKIKKISESKEGQGGKSGEFQFLTHDKRLRLKTTNDAEAGTFFYLTYLLVRNIPGDSTELWRVLDQEQPFLDLQDFRPFRIQV